MRKWLKKLIDVPLPIVFIVGCAIQAPVSFLTGHTLNGFMCVGGVALVVITAGIIYLRLRAKGHKAIARNALIGNKTKL